MQVYDNFKFSKTENVCLSRLSPRFQSYETQKLEPQKMSDKKKKKFGIYGDVF